MIPKLGLLTLSQELIFELIGMVQYLQVHHAPTAKIVVLQKDSKRNCQLSLSRDNQFLFG